ncbi:hypothetical protein QA635_40020 [Bradyrhizobium brasilense]|uniref:hypothetical protein n=1 Tax=Bradyrhizobium brasilense TaxID=1419277 RepID=UPI0024B13B85|nr:hypothetical protein [Bradyrhizobium australafricanum]WFU32596.1 hypothetical protein QA635_40020 [Bradyrhizobium australafricanum]
MVASIERSGRDRFATDTRLIAADVACRLALLRDCHGGVQIGTVLGAPQLLLRIICNKQQGMLGADLALMGRHRSDRGRRAMISNLGWQAVTKSAVMPGETATRSRKAAS